MENKILQQRLCWQKTWECFDYGWGDENKTGITYNSVSFSISLFGYWVGLDFQRYSKLGFVDRLIKKILPIYIRLYPAYYWISLWSAPTTPTKRGDYIKSLRITLRQGQFHSKLVYVFKTGEGDK